MLPKKGALALPKKGAFTLHITLTTIFIYSYVGIEKLLDNEYFNILKTKNIFLIGHNEKDFKNAFQLKTEQFDMEDLPKEISKLKLNVPSNFEDSHSIANEWAMYRWAKSLNIQNDDKLQNVLSIVNNQIYFKYLQTIYPTKDFNFRNKNELKLKYDNRDKIKILYIDDEEKKGWFTILSHLLETLNGNKILLEPSNIKFKNKTRKEIIKESIELVFNNSRVNYDIIILDFRLLTCDFDEKDPSKITGYKILERIKEKNPGVQVIVFSATNKIWNLEKIMNAGANGFMIKESPENSIDECFTEDTIYNLLDTIESCIDRLFLINFYNSSQNIKENITNINRENYFIQTLLNEVIIFQKAANKVNPESTELDTLFLLVFNILELFKNNNRNETEKQHSIRYTIEKILTNDLKAIKRNDYNTIDKIKKVTDARNNFIHNNNIHLSVNDLFNVTEIAELLTNNLQNLNE